MISTWSRFMLSSMIDSLQWTLTSLQNDSRPSLLIANIRFFARLIHVSSMIVLSSDPHSVIVSSKDRSNRYCCLCFSWCRSLIIKISSRVLRFVLLEMFNLSRQRCSIHLIESASIRFIRDVQSISSDMLYSSHRDVFIRDAQSYVRLIQWFSAQWY